MMENMGVVMQDFGKKLTVSFVHDLMYSVGIINAKAPPLSSLEYSFQAGVVSCRKIAAPGTGGISKSINQDSLADKLERLCRSTMSLKGLKCKQILASCGAEIVDMLSHTQVILNCNTQDEH